MKYQGCLLAVKDIAASKHFYEKVCAEMKNISSLQWVHEIKVYPWGQRDIRVYDPDRHNVSS